MNRRNRSRNRSQPRPEPVPQPLPGTWEFHRQRIIGRFYWTLDNLATVTSSALTFILAGLAEYLVIDLSIRIIGSDGPYVATFVNVARVVAAAGSVLGIMIHSAMSLYGQIKVEWKLTNDEL